MVRSSLALSLVSWAAASRVRLAEKDEAPIITDCPTSTMESPCPADMRYCRVNGGCFPQMSEDKGTKTCGTPLCPLPKDGGNRHEEVVVDEKALEGCPRSVKKRKCAGKRRFCRANGGCYKESEAKQCKVELCPVPESSSSGKSSPASKPARKPAKKADAWRPPSGGDLFQPVDTNAPPGHIFPHSSAHYMPPVRITAGGKHQTNKFWTNWISTKANVGQKPVFSMPYALQFSDADDSWKCHYYDSGQNNAWCKSNPKMGNTEYHFFGPDGTCGHCHCCKRALEVKAELSISHKKEPSMKYNREGPRSGRIAYYISRFSASYSMGIKEKTSRDHFTITQEDLMGVHVEVKHSGGQVKFPIYRGMPYVSGRYQHATPRIASPQGYVRKMTKISKGVFEFLNDEGAPDKLWECAYYERGQNDAWCKSRPVDHGMEHNFFGNPGSPCGDCDCCRRPTGIGDRPYGSRYQAFVLDYNGNFIDGDFKNTSSGFVFNRKLDGWVRMAHLVEDQDAAVLQKHAPSILESVQLDVKGVGDFSYKFKRSGNKGVPHLHWGWRHQKMLMQNGDELPERKIHHIMAPTKGKMVPYLGSEWRLKIDVGRAKRLNLLPDAVPTGSKRKIVEAELDKELQKLTQCGSKSWSTLECEGPRTWIFTAGFYTNGKGLQKLGTLCLMSRKLFGAGDARTAGCAKLLKKAFKCHYDSSSGCGGVPRAYYDTKWGGIASKQGFDNKMCGLADFGNACYNDHHYHYGYFIHAGAILLKIMPEMKSDSNFVAYINLMIRDISNPSTADKYFPQFRAFDWYDLHSWSHGVTPSADGKDEESTSEDVNAYFGIQMWAKEIGHKNLENTAAMLLSLLSHSAANLFLMKEDNQVHPADYTKNRVTGIFFESKVHYGTFFGADEIFIHGIQMLPLSPALRLARDKEFCKQEWRDVLSKKGLPVPGKSSWSSLLLTGNLAFHKTEDAWNKLLALPEFDRGLSKSWALYWTASIAAER